jgi:hypothetical protein
MLGDMKAAATVAVKDLAAAKRFYETTLGLKPIGKRRFRTRRDPRSSSSIGRSSPERIKPQP